MLDKTLNKIICSRFHLSDGQFFAISRVKNQRWFLNGNEFGFGDLHDENIHFIGIVIEPGEVFEGFNEHHMSEFMQRESPMIRIDSGGVTFPDRVPVSEETWNKIHGNQ